MKTLTVRYMSVFIFLSLVVGLGVMIPYFARSQAGTAITGYAWSETIGWISLNCSNEGTCATSNYGLTVATDGTISGYAWSENVGWISAQSADLTGCPQAPCSARISGGSAQGWLKVLASSDLQSGGWDGWISLSGAGYGLTQTGSALLGYAWGDTNLGWIDFSANYACAGTAGYYCSGNDRMYRELTCATSSVETCSYLCTSGACVAAPSPTGSLSASPSLVHSGGTVSVSWTTTNTSSCTVEGSNGDSWTGVSGSQTSGPITGATSYTLTCIGLDAVVNVISTLNIIVAPKWQEI